MPSSLTPARPLLGALACGGVLATHLVLAAPAAAATLTVTSLADSGPGSLRAALATASPGDVIDVTAAGTMTVTSPLAVTVPLTIQGPGAANLSLSGGGTTVVLDITGTGAPTVLRGLTVADGDNPGFGNGGGITASGADLQLMGVGVRDNTAGRSGGGIDLQGGSLTVTASTIADNTGGYYGGGISTVAAPVTITGSTLSGNTAGNAGGAVAIDTSGDLTVTASTVTGNDAQAVPGVYSAGDITITDSLLADNVATISPAIGIAVDTDNDLTVTNSTVTGNGGSFTPAVLNARGDMTLDHATVAGNQPAASTAAATDTLAVTDSILTGSTDDVAGASTSIGHSLLGTSTTVPGGSNGNLVGVDPLLGALADNGGPTGTRMPADGSPVIDAGTPGYTATAGDQRDYVRTVDGDSNGTPVVDMGAVEAHSTPRSAIPTPPSGPTEGPVTGTDTAAPHAIAPQLAATGTTAAPWLWTGLVLLGAGVLATVVGRRPSHER